MSINTITPTFNNHVPTGEVDRIKAASDAKNNTDKLTQSLTDIGSSHGRAAKKVRDRKDRLEIKALEMQTDDSYFYSLLEDSF